MPSRQLLELQANAVNVTAASYPNDSKLEQIVLYKLAHLTATSTATTTAPTAVNAAVAGAANV